MLIGGSVVVVCVVIKEHGAEERPAEGRFVLL